MSRRMQVLLDGDWLLYTAGFACQHTEYLVFDPTDAMSFGPFDNKSAMKEAFDGNVPEGFNVYARTFLDPIDHTLHTVKQMMQSQVTKIEEHFNCMVESVTVYLDGNGNFRSELATIKPYKGNRAEASKPLAYNDIRQYLLDNYPTVVSNNCESDDCLATALRQAGKDKAICVGVDKDLLQVPGLHLNPNKGFKKVSNSEGRTRLFRQAVMGDAVDNIGGAYKVGPKAAAKIITPNMCADAMWGATVEAYQATLEKYPDANLYNGLDAFQAALENMRLVYLQKEDPGKEPLWTPPDS